MKKIDTLGYFLLEDCMLALSSAVLELLTAKSPVFSFRTFSIFTTFQDMIAQSSAQNKFMLRFRKIASFWNGPNPFGTGVDTYSSKLCGF